MTAPDPNLPVRALLERLGVPVVPTLQSSGAFEPVELGSAAAEAPTQLEDRDDPLSFGALTTGSGASSELAAPPDHVGRLVILGEIGRGGMGRVYAAHDPELAREVAVKVVRDPGNQTSERLARFVSEAQITAQLQHPGIVPVHDIGVTHDGAVYYVMKRVQGRSLRQLLDALRERPDLAAEWTLHRTVSAFLQVCDAVGFAHQHGVLHRDLKPDNILIGPFGEVLVVDWGLATLVDAPPETEEDAVAAARQKLEEMPTLAIPALRDALEPITPKVRRTTTAHTMDGASLGTPGYMSPEQARGDRSWQGPRSDVFSLGAVLYELLTGDRAYRAATPIQLMFQLMSGPPEDPRERTPARRIPEEIAQIALRALALDPVERFADASQLAVAVRGFLAGSQRRAAAATWLAEARTRWDAYLAVRVEQASATTKEAILASSTDPWTPMAEKRDLLTTRDRLEALGSERLAAFSGFVTACDRALSHDPESPEARALLAEGWWTRLLEADAEGDQGRVAWCADRVRIYDDGSREAALRGAGSLTLDSAPGGAEVLCQRVRQEGVVWTLEEPIVLGTAPIDVPLDMGSYVLTLRSPGRRDVTYPVHITRGRRWTAGTVRLLTDADIGDDWVYVPGGPFQAGGDPGALEAEPSRQITLPGFLIRRRPLSLRDYLEFINALQASDPEEAHARAPRAASGVHQEGGRYFELTDGTWSIPEVDSDGDTWNPDWPLLGVSWEDARACAAWVAEQRGEEVTVPTALQLEKAMRGVDGRIWPWGNRFDSTLAKIRTSRPGRPQPEAVGAFASDVSVYGMQDACGSIRELCGDPDWRGDPSRRPVKGASWNHLPDAARCASALGTSRRNVSAFMGFRLLRPLPPETDE